MDNQRNNNSKKNNGNDLYPYFLGRPDRPPFGPSSGQSTSNSSSSNPNISYQQNNNHSTKIMGMLTRRNGKTF